MPVTTNPYAPITFAGDGVTSIFTCTFPFQLPTDLVVTRTVTATGVPTTLVLGTDYSVLPVQSPYQNSPASTGSVTLLLGPLASGNTLTIGRATPLTQLTTWVPNDPNPSTATMNAVDKLTLIAQETEAQVIALQKAQTGGIVTTAVFAIAAVNLSQTVIVNSVKGLAVGNTVQISNVINTLFGTITAINATTLTLTITTNAITSGLAGNNMPVGSPVQLSAIPFSASTIFVEDGSISPVAAATIGFLGTASGAIGSIPVALYINSYGANTALISGYLPSGVDYAQVNFRINAPVGRVLTNPLGSQTIGYTTGTAAGTVLQHFVLGDTPDFDYLNANKSITAGTAGPLLLQALNSPSNTQVPSYDSASGQFRWIAAGQSVLTTASFVIAAVNSSQSVIVNNVSSLAVGNTVQISNVTNTMYGQITAINSGTLTLTVTTTAITSGAAGNTMASGSAVQLGVAVGNSVLVQDTNGFASTTATTLNFAGASSNPITLRVSGVAGGVATIQAATSANFTIGQISATALGIDQFAVLRHGTTTWTNFGPTIANTLPLTTDGVNLTFGQITGSFIQSGTLLPTLLQATNSPTDTQIPSYDLASGKFKWVNQGGGGLPGLTNTKSAFLRDDGTWSYVFNPNTSPGALVFAGAETNGTVAPGFSTFGLQGVYGFTSTNAIYIGALTRGVSTWTYSPGTATGLVVNGYLQVTMNNIGATVGDDRIQAIGNYISTNRGMRSIQGYWQASQLISNPATTLTVDANTAPYAEISNITNAVAVTLADTSSNNGGITNDWQSEITLLVAMGSVAYAFTWPNTSWVAGTSAPALSANTTYLLKFSKRKSQSTWNGYILNVGSGTTYTDAQARTAVLQTTYLTNSSTINWNITPGATAQPFIPAASITGTQLAAGAINSSSLFGTNVIPATAISANSIPTSKLVLPGGSTVYMDGNGNFSAPGGGGSGVNIQSNGTALGSATTIDFRSNLTVTFFAGVAHIDAGGTGGGGQSPIQLENNGATFGASGAYTAYNFAPVAGSGYKTGFGPVNSKFTGSVPTANLTTAFGWYNVLFYGAKGDGVTDDAPAIQSAINAAIANGGGTIYLPSGTYKIFSALTMSSGVNIVGDGSNFRNFSGQSTSVSRLLAGTVGMTMLNITGEKGGMHWREFVLDGNAVAAIGMYFEVLTYSLVEHIGIYNCTSYGIQISVPNVNDCTGNLFQNLTIDSSSAVSGTCIRIGAQTNGHNACHNTFTNIFMSHGNHAIDIDWSDNNSFFQVFCFKAAAAGSNYDVYLRGDFPVSGVGSNNRFYQLEGDVEAFATTGGSYNEIYGYDQGNGQRSPLVHTGAILFFQGYSRVAETVSGHSNFAAIALAQGQAICFSQPTAANTGVYMQYNGTNLRVTKDGGNTWTNLV